MKRHGKDAKVAVLPFARYQLPKHAVRMPRRIHDCATWRRHMRG